MRYFHDGISTSATHVRYTDTTVKGPPLQLGTGRVWVHLERIGLVPTDKIQVIPPAPYEAGYGC